MIKWRFIIIFILAFFLSVNVSCNGPTIKHPNGRGPLTQAKPPGSRLKIERIRCYDECTKADIYIFHKDRIPERLCKNRIVRLHGKDVSFTEGAISDINFRKNIITIEPTTINEMKEHTKPDDTVKIYDELEITDRVKIIDNDTRLP